MRISFEKSFSPRLPSFISPPTCGAHQIKKTSLEYVCNFVEEDMTSPSQALLALPELPGLDGPGSHSGAEQWKRFQSVIEDYGILHKLGSITGDNHGSNDVLCRLLSQFLESEASHGMQSTDESVVTAILSTFASKPFLFMGGKEAVLEACTQIEEVDEASFNMDMFEDWKKQKELGWRQMGPLGKIHNVAVHIRADDYRYNLFRRRAGKILGLDNDTRWNSWFLLPDTALSKDEHIKWYQDKYYDALVDDYLTPLDWQTLRDTRTFLQPFWKITLLTEGYRSTLDRTLFTMDVLC
jgi:hypothetical protein